MNDTPRTNKYIHINTTQQLLEAVICDCRNNITSDGSAVLDGYVDLDENSRKVADACWHVGMDRMGREILMWAEDQPDSIKVLRDEAAVCQFHFQRVMAGDSFNRLNQGDREIMMKILDFVKSLNPQPLAQNNT